MAKMLITADKEADLKELKARLAEHGMKEVEVISTSKVLAGEIDKGMVVELLKIPGVRFVEEAREPRLPSPDSPVQ